MRLTRRFTVSISTDHGFLMFKRRNRKPVFSVGHGSKQCCMSLVLTFLTALPELNMLKCAIFLYSYVTTSIAFHGISCTKIEAYVVEDPREYEVVRIACLS